MVDEPDGSAGTPSELALKFWQLRCIWKGEWFVQYAFYMLFTSTCHVLHMG